MLLLFETAAGHALYELKHEDKLKKLDADKLASKLSEDPRKALSLKTFAPFRDTTEAVAAASDFVESKLNKQLKKFLKKQVPNGGVELGVADPKLGALIKEKLNIPCVASSFVNECLRGARSLAIDGDSSIADAHDVRAMQLGLSHALSRYKLKFSPDKVDTMVVQAVGLLDDLDKEVNTYAMRVKEWYGWHFPEMARLVNDNVHYAELVRKVRDRTNFKNSRDAVTEILDDDETAAQTLLDTAEMSMGTEVDPSDMDHVVALADQVVELSAYRTRLADYLRARMQALAPNLTTLVGELVGARLVQHALRLRLELLHLDAFLGRNLEDGKAEVYDPVLGALLENFTRDGRAGLKHNLDTLGPQGERQEKQEQKGNFSQDAHGTPHLAEFKGEEREKNFA